ncbi:unnamed protein product [Protopolystoma xenopodis]|uniref:Helix-turn-helix domain-containing protein n=1 Tax=Protopolystoma xenopodis TaxID=117903 RepID=A0A3S5ACI9_9PLAT|nr:unnamed protein product [Protopolystoma xenopodis]
MITAKFYKTNIFDLEVDVHPVRDTLSKQVQPRIVDLILDLAVDVQPKRNSLSNQLKKIGILFSLIIRSLRLTDNEFWDEELDKLTRICLSNGYPRSFIEKNGFYENQIRNQDNKQKWICLPSSKLSQQLQPLLGKWNSKVITKEKMTLFPNLPTQHEKTDKLECSEVYRIKCDNCEQKYVGETGRKIGLRIKEHQRLCRNMDAQRSEIAEHIARMGYEIDWKSSERLAVCGENTRKRKIRNTDRERSNEPKT